MITTLLIYLLIGFLDCLLSEFILAVNSNKLLGYFTPKSWCKDKLLGSLLFLFFLSKSIIKFALLTIYSCRLFSFSSSKNSWSASVSTLSISKLRSNTSEYLSSQCSSSQLLKSLHMFLCNFSVILSYKSCTIKTSFFSSAFLRLEVSCLRNFLFTCSFWQCWWLFL